MGGRRQIATIKDIEFRGNYSRTFRAPAITELFLPIVNAFSTVTDHCPPASDQRRCRPGHPRRELRRVLGPLPGPTPDPASTATVSIQSGGNPALGNETAESLDRWCHPASELHSAVQRDG